MKPVTHGYVEGFMIIQGFRAASNQRIALCFAAYIVVYLLEKIKGEINGRSICRRCYKESYEKGV